MNNLIEVRFESLFQAVFCLTDVLFTTSFARDAVCQVVAVACHIVTCSIFSACALCCNLARFVQEWAISTVFSPA